MEQRMYSLVLRQLNPMQKGVQTTHGVVEFANKYGDTPEYKQWAEKDKTLIILDGGVYQDMEIVGDNLFSWGIPFARFYEPDLNKMCTAITFLADERIWNYVEYPDFDTWIKGVDKYTREVCYGYQKSRYVTTDEDELKSAEKEYFEFMGGEKYVKLRQFIRTKHLAM